MNSQKTGAQAIVERMYAEWKRGMLTYWVLGWLLLQPMYGLEIQKKIDSSSQGKLAVRPSTIYQLLRHLETRGLVTSRWEQTPVGPPRAYYATTPTGREVLSLCNDSHPKSPSNAAVQDNNGTLSLSYANVSATRLLMRSYTDDVGNLIPVQPDTLLVPPELEETAYGIWRTMNKPDTADNLANFTQSYLRNVIVWDYLTDANAWFLIDSVAAKTCLKWLDRVPLEFALDPTSEFRLESRWRGYMRYSYGFKDWRWIYGNNPS